MFEEAAEASKEMKKSKKKRVSSSATGSTASASPKGETAAALETPRPTKSTSPIVEKVDSEVQFKIGKAAVDEMKEEAGSAVAVGTVNENDTDEEVDEENLVPVEITDGLKRRLEEDQVRDRVFPSYVMLNRFTAIVESYRGSESN